MQTQIHFMFKKIVKRVLLTLAVLITVFSAYALISGKTFLFKALYHNFANIDDYKIFDNNEVAIAQPQPWNNDAQYNKVNYPAELNSLLESLSSTGLLVIKNDSVLYERYWDGYSDSSKSGSFSMAKSITSLLVGIALKEGKIKSLDEPVGNYLPEFKDGERGKLTIKHCLTMSSGSDWDESYWNPLTVTTEAYYGNDVYKTATGVKIIHAPGSLHSYKSGDTQLLGLVVEKATGKTLSAYASEKLWQPMGAEHAALWSTDHANGNEKAYCCFNSNTRDFARIGKLMLDSGQWKGQEIISKDYWQESIRANQINDGNAPCNYYGYQWWLVPHHKGIFYARGILGQYIIVIPEKKMIIVRLGKMTSIHRKNTVPAEVDALIDWGMEL
jgi:CubicO group peptidase (beta-lactamase class C family)